LFIRSGGCNESSASAVNNISRYLADILRQKLSVRVAGCSSSVSIVSIMVVG
jgi:hypothetical protein